jgi:hypothetical protein
MRSAVIKSFSAKALVGLIAGSALNLLASMPVAATCGTGAAGYHYAYESTVGSGYGGLYNPPNCVAGPDYGWVGIDGLLTYPSHFPDLNGNALQNHAAGYAAISFADGGWVQEGWYAGCLVNEMYCRQSVLGRYTEILNKSVTPNFYEFIDWDTAAFSGTSIFRIEYASGGCWKMYFDYSTLKKTYCGLPGSGRPEAVGEVKTIVGNSVEMPLTVYGSSSPNTNSGLRIKSANGWGSWTTTVSTGYYDERNGQPGCTPSGSPPCLYYYISYFNSYYKFEAYGS